MLHVMGRQSRHAACDRCRGHKLRCQYTDSDAAAEAASASGSRPGAQGGSASCRRCRRAGVECVQSTTVRAVRASRAIMSSRAFKEATRIPSPGQSPEPPPGSSSVSTAAEGQRMPHHQVRTCEHMPDDPLSVASGFIFDKSLLGPDMVPHFGDDLFYMDVGGEEAAFSVTEGGPSSAAPLFDSSRQMHGKHHQHFGFMDAAASLADEARPENGALRGAEQSASAAADTDLEMVLDAIDFNPSAESLVHRLSVLSISLHELSIETGRPPQPQQQKQRSTLHGSRPNPPAKGAIGFRCEDDYPIDAILMETQAFVEILGSYIVLEPCQCAESGGVRVSSSWYSSLASSSSSSSNAAASDGGFEDPNRMGVDDMHQRGEQSTQSDAQLDIHSALVVISCYTRIMRIYSNLVMYVRRQVHGNDAAAPHHGRSSSSASASASAPPGLSTRTGMNLPVLQLGTIQIRNDTALQALLLVRMGLHLVERIERILDTLIAKSTCPCHYLAVPAHQQPPTPGQESATSRKPAESSVVDIGVESRSTSDSTSESASSSGPGAGDQPENGASASRRRSSHSRRTADRSPRSTIGRIIQLAVRQEDSESRDSGHRGIGSLKEDIRLLEQLLQ